ncbi:hypothetical protein V8E55_001115 [Tylopilus felleus]
MDQNVTIKRLSHISAPIIQIYDSVLDSWKYDRLIDADALLTDVVPASKDSSHDVLACRALVRTRLRQWDDAIDDAQKSIKIKPSLFGYIAMSLALVGNGEKHKAYRACDIAFQHCHSSHVPFLLLLKAIIIFMAGEHDDAISRVDDVISTVHFSSICHVVQAYMHLLLGNSHMESRDYNSAVRSFERAQAQMRPHTSPELLQLSLISGWKFDNLGTIIQRQLCEALHVAGHTKRAGEAILEITNSFGDETYTSDGLSEWVSGKLIRRAYSCRAYKTSPQISHNVASRHETARAIQPLRRLETIFLHHSDRRSPQRY